MFESMYGDRQIWGLGAYLGPESPTLDKIIPALGYVPGNVWVISHRANTIKSDASLEELKTLTANLEKKLNELNGDTGENQPGADAL